jgi:hypothetical protein
MYVLDSAQPYVLLTVLQGDFIRFPYKLIHVQSTAHKTIHFGLCTALISRELARAVSRPNTYIHTRCSPEGVAEASQIFLRDAHVLPKLFSYE